MPANFPQIDRLLTDWNRRARRRKIVYTIVGLVVVGLAVWIWKG